MARRTPFIVFDADMIVPGLYQGSYPPIGNLLRESLFDAVVLCARDFQPPPTSFPNVDVIYAPSLDDRTKEPSRETLQLAMNTAKEVAARVAKNQNVLVTCQAGLNRSGLVNAMALHFLYGWDGVRCVRQVQGAREDALFNLQFVAVLSRLPGK